MNDDEERRLLTRIATLPEGQRAPVERVARGLLQIGSYDGSETDAVTDALSLIERYFQ